MKLRNFLYLNTEAIDDYVAAIDGGIYDEESQAFSTIGESMMTGKANLGFANGGAEHSGRQTEEIKRSVKNTFASKFDTVYQYLLLNEDEGLKYYESLSDETYSSLCRDDFLEVLVTARFSKMKEVTDLVKQIGDLANLFEPFMGQEVLDKDAKEAFEGFKALSTLKTGKGIASVFEFEDKKYPLVAQLDERFFRCQQEQFVGEGYLLCKIIKKIPKGKSVALDEIFGSMEKLGTNREERRKLKKSAKNPDEIRDEVKGPALMGLPIAFYH